MTESNLEKMLDVKLIEYKNAYWQENQQCFLELLNLVNCFPKSYIRKLNANGKKRFSKIVPPYKHLKIWIEEITKQYDEQIKDVKTRVYWILNNLSEAPRCMNERCNRPLIDKSFDATKKNQPYYCSHHCMNTSHLKIDHGKQTKSRHSKEYWQEVEQKKKQTKIDNGHEPNWVNSSKAKQTIAKKIVEDPNYYFNIEQKTKQTKIANGHDPNWHNQEQMVKTRFQKYGGVWESEEIKQKRKQTSLEKYGVDDSNKSDVVKQHKKEGCLKKYEVDSYSKTQMYHEQMIAIDEQRKQKELETKRKNGTFNSSKSEDRIYSFLTEEFDESNIEKQYRSEAYPFACDFYIKSIDLYIECNFSWTHGGHFFDKDNEEDIKTLELWKSKNTKFYDNAIDTWTRRDLLKKKTAEDNKLRYLVLWKEEKDKNRLKSLIDAFMAQFSFQKCK